MTKRLDPLLVLSEDAITLGKWIAECSETAGPGDYACYDSITDRFHEIPELELLEAIAELQDLQLVQAEEVIGGIPHVIRPNVELFEFFDPLTRKTNPRQDAAKIASYLLESEETFVTAAEFCDAYAWGVRRLNPALSIVGELVSEASRISALEQPFTVWGFLEISDAERIQLESFVTAVLSHPFEP